eukprot:m.300516 g.300516  ORF g.300516 m.300516 type:complete len:127 (-) comp55211_c1_seq15:704-1084(-)
MLLGDRHPYCFPFSHCALFLPVCMPQFAFSRSFAFFLSFSHHHVPLWSSLALAHRFDDARLWTNHAPTTHAHVARYVMLMQKPPPLTSQALVEFSVSTHTDAHSIRYVSHSTRYFERAVLAFHSLH